MKSRTLVAKAIGIRSHLAQWAFFESLSQVGPYGDAVERSGAFPMRWSPIAGPLGRGKNQLYTRPVLADRRPHRLLTALAHSRSSGEVAHATVDGLKEIFHSNVGGVFFFDPALQTTERSLYGMRDVDFEEYETHLRPYDYVLSLLIERQVPLHNGQVYSDDELDRDPLYSGYGRRVQVYRYMCAPLYGSHAELQGMLRICRGPQSGAFDAKDLALITALGGYISSALARVSTPALADRGRLRAALTYRELEVARLAASGRDNRQIALHIGLARETVKQTLRRVYQKLGVRCRAEMAVWLARRSLI